MPCLYNTIPTQKTISLIRILIGFLPGMDKFRNKYRIASARAAWWNYGWNGIYFITICTKNRYPFFGEIQNGAMKRSHQGIIADVLWHQIPYHSQHIELGAFVVMPNHIHGILILNDLGNGDSAGFNHSAGTNDFAGTNVETGHALSLQHLSLQNLPVPPQPTPAHSRYLNQGKNTISSIVGSYKSAVTKNANRLGLEFGWQTRFHDNVIRTDADQ